MKAGQKGLVLALVGGGLAAMVIGGPTIDAPRGPEGAFRARVVRIAESQLGQTESVQYAAPVLGIQIGTPQAERLSTLEWCGLFATWVLKRAGADVRWILGRGISPRLPATQDPKPGDWLYIHRPNQHIGIVERIEGDRVYSIDGNSIGRAVVRNVRNRREISTFYSIGGLVP